MKRFAQQFKKQAEITKLTVQERFVLRNKITAFMEYHPLPQTDPVIYKKTLLLGKPFLMAGLPWRKWRISTTLAVLVMVIILPVAAEYTVPGDVLYPLKVRVNEEVRSTLARTPYERVEWESKRIERRISEARILAKAGLLTPETEEAVIEAVAQHRTNADAEIEILRGENNSDDLALANMTLASIFEVHSTVFNVGSDTDSTSNSSSTALFKNLAGAIEGGRVEFSARTEEDVISYDRLIAEIEKQTSRAYELLYSLKASLTTQETADINRRLEDIATRINNIQSVISEIGTTNSASVMYEALHDTKKLIAFMNDIYARKTVAVENIVPMTLSIEERLAHFNLELMALKEAVSTLEQKIQLITDGTTQEKVAFYLPELQLFLEQYETVDSTTIASAEELLVSSQAILTLLTQLIDEAVESVPVSNKLETDKATTSTSTSIN